MTWQTRSLSQPKTALVLAGGGVTGAVYELGALKALDELLAPAGRTVNDFDVYVGTSAGAILGSLLANGIAVDTMCAILAERHPVVRGLRHSDIFKWNARGLARWAAHLPGRLARAGGRCLRQRSLTPLLLALSEAAPPGLYDGLALARYLQDAYLALGGSDDFNDLTRDLYLVATSLNTGERAVFGRGQAAGCSISRGVAASIALPMLYAPVQIGAAWYMDGGVRGNASVDVAIEQGAQLVICINPLVPLTAAPGDDPTHGVTWRAMRISSHAGLHYHLKHLRRQHPDVDILVIEPRADDVDFLSAPLMDFDARQSLLEHGFQTVRRHLAASRPQFAAVLARHGLPVPLAPADAFAERAGASSGGPTADVREPAGARPWPSQARPGRSTGAPAHTRPQREQALEGAPRGLRRESPAG